ncbi:helix-turn-helix domain-containing protein [Streptomyces sp. NPDC005355]|uniref:PucR family transcriptional regulator n=1 Tax=Streptomyces sp. NPDC005355 TaxID=3157038 RepID=UPI00339EA131
MDTKAEESDSPAIDRWVAVIAAELNGRLAAETEKIKDVLESNIPELRKDSRLLELLGASIEGNVDTVLHTLQYNISAEHLEAPAAAMEYARRLAQRGVPVNALVRAYRLGQTTLLDDALTRITATDLAPELRLAVAHRMFTVVSGYIDWISQQVVDVYERERNRWQASNSSMRAVRVHELLSHDTTAPPPTDLGLGYTLDQYHLSTILWFPEDLDADQALNDLERAAQDLADIMKVRRPPLFVAVDRLSGWAWIPLGERATVNCRDISRHVAGRTDALSVAAGSPARGHHGFRVSHERARTAQNVAMLHKPHPRRVTFYDDPGLPVIDLLSKEVDKTRKWVIDTLGPLAANSDNASRTRDTLHAFLDSGASHKSAAERLNLHYNTVKYRVKKAEDELGIAIGDNRLHIELALLACYWLGDTVLTN